MTYPPYPPAVERLVNSSGDPVRYAFIAMAIERLRSEGIQGSFAEIGVWRGDLSEFIHTLAPSRKFHLFDTFQGFPEDGDDRFRDTSVDLVRKRLIANPANIDLNVGEFPSTAAGLEDEQFSMVMYDADKYEPAVAALEFFYPKLSHGGYFFAHDFNNEAEPGVKKAMQSFLEGKPEMLIEIPDRWGTALFRKI